MSYGPKSPRQSTEHSASYAPSSQKRHHDLLGTRGKHRWFWLIALGFFIPLATIMLWLYINPKSSPASVRTTEEFASVADTVEIARPAVVQVLAVNGLLVSQGSGVILSANGEVLTNAHVIEDADRIEISLIAGQEESFEAELLGIAPCSDLAVLKLPSNPYPYPFIERRPNFDIRVGDEVIAMGYPLNLERLRAIAPSATTNRISRLNMSLNNISSLIEHQAVINPGNSGGPLLDRSGYLVGINTMSIYETQGLFYAIDLPTIERNWNSLRIGESAADLPRLEMNTTIEGHVDGLSERHCWLFAAQAQERIRIRVEGSSLDPIVWLYSPNNLLLESDLNNNPNRQIADIDYRIENTGIYQVVLGSNSSDPIGNYQLTLESR